jgi:hypothetical protein
MRINQTESKLGHLTGENVIFGLVTCGAVVVAHAIAYMTHEYAHSCVAWALGWMRNPLALDYGSPTLYNILFLGDVADNVQYAPIFAAGRGRDASIIALSGTVVGNGIVYAGLVLLSTSREVAATKVGLSAVYWIALMCAGNIWGYVPIRAITSHADIAIAAKGLAVSTWALFPFLIVPALGVFYHFFVKMVPRCVGPLAAGSRANLTLITALTAYWFFAFFGGDGIDGNYGLMSQLLAITSKYLLFPVAMMWLTSRSAVFVDRA